ncbi:MAG TPA: tripartite tricarboxylate transporter substrate binding protein [Xanthobacteraceae bacterium]|nr:tripartite tricarboxylate transporter substrate binding protein [Xanthobacteraceae bacterium]
MKRVRMSTTRRAIIGGMAVNSAAAVARAFGAPAPAAYPSQPIRLIVPFTPGGGADLVARLLAKHFSDLLGQPAVVENRPGAAGRVGTGLVAKAAPDGYTLLVTTESSLVIARHIGAPISYDPFRDFAPISLLTRNAVVLVVNPAVPAKTLREYIDLARAHPGELLFASSGVGGPNHLAGETFNRLTGLEITHVPFAGTGLALQAVIANQVGAMWGFTAGVVPHVRSGALRALALASPRRSPVLPEVPTFAEAGVPGFQAVSWVGMVAPAGTPATVIEALWQASERVLHLPDVVEVLGNTGTEIVASRPEAFAQTLKTDDEQLSKMPGLFDAK